MKNLNLEEFIDIYLSSVLSVVREDCLLGLDDFYDHVFQNASERSGLSMTDIKYIHHAFHWSLFLPQNSFLEIFIPKVISENGDSHGYHVRIKQLTEKSALGEKVLMDYGEWIRERFAYLRKVIA